MSVTAGAQPSEPDAVGWRAQQVGTLAEGRVILGGDQDGVTVLGDDPR